MYVILDTLSYAADLSLMAHLLLCNSFRKRLKGNDQTIRRPSTRPDSEKNSRRLPLLPYHYYLPWTPWRLDGTSPTNRLILSAARLSGMIFVITTAALILTAYVVAWS